MENELLKLCFRYIIQLRSKLTFLFGAGKGSGAAMVIGILAVVGSTMCLVTGQTLKKYTYTEE